MTFLLLLLLSPPAAASPKICNVMLPPWNAKGDNRTEDTSAVEAALRDCTQGIVLLPKTFVFYLRPLHLPSHTTLHIDGDISGWREIKTWPNSTTKLCNTSPYGTARSQVITAPQKESLIWSANTTNITVKGRGTVDGSGWRWWPLRNLPGNYWHNCRPSLIEFGRRGPAYDSGVSDVTVEGVTLKDSPFWTFSGRDMHRLRISSVHVTTTGCGYAEAPNTDGFNIQGQDILIEDSSVRNGDDCVPIFPPTRNVTVRNMTCECGNGMVPCVWPSFSTPGQGGDIKDVLFDGAHFKNTKQAVTIKALGSFVGTASNITYRNFVLDNVGQAVMINMYAGKIMCGPGNVSCTGIVMNGVRLDSTVTATRTAAAAAAAPRKEGANALLYTCANAVGSAEDCNPVPCGWTPPPGH
eukprot:gene9719-5455_t